MISLALSLSLSLPFLFPSLILRAEAQEGFLPRADVNQTVTEGGNATSGVPSGFIRNSNPLTSQSIINSNSSNMTDGNTITNGNATATQTSSAFQSPAEELQGPPIGLVSAGTINSVINAPTTKWIATGNWSINVQNGTMKFFGTNMSWYNSNGTAAHTHEFLNFVGDSGRVISLQQPGNNVNIKGIMDVGTNNRVVWYGIPTTIDINGKKAITISVDDKGTNQHFASQPILGVVNSFVLCSDIPGATMVVLPPCTPNVPAISNLSATQTNNLTSANNGTNAIFSIYENTSSGIKIAYPSEWNLQQGRNVSPSLKIAAKFIPSADPDSHFTIGIRKLDGSGTGVEDYATNTLNGYRENVKNFQSTVFHTNGMLSNNSAYAIDGTYQDDKSVKRHLFEVGTVIDNNAYILQFDSEDSKATSYLPVLETMISSFQIIANTQGSAEVDTSSRGSSSSSDGSGDNNGNDNDNDNNNDNNDDNNNVNSDNSNDNSNDNNSDNCNDNNNDNSNDNNSDNCNDNNNDNSNDNDQSLDDLLPST